MEEIIGLIVALSVAAERLVEITKGTIPILGTPRVNQQQERWRKSALQVLAIISGIAVSFMAEPMISGALPPNWHNTTGILVIGLLASGGSGFWNALMTYLLQLKDIQKTVVQPVTIMPSSPSRGSEDSLLQIVKTGRSTA